MIALALLIRHGGLLRHDIEEWLGPAQSRAASLALSLLLLLLPLATFQGWGWLPLWWLALLFSYFDRTEKAMAALVAAGVVAVGPALEVLELRLVTTRNPLYAASLAAVDGQPDPYETRAPRSSAPKRPPGPGPRLPAGLGVASLGSGRPTRRRSTGACSTTTRATPSPATTSRTSSSRQGTTTRR